MEQIQRSAGEGRSRFELAAAFLLSIELAYALSRHKDGSMFVG